MGGIIAVLQKFETVAPGMVGQPVPDGTGVVRTDGNGDIPIGDDSQFGKPLGGSGEDALIVRVPAAFDIGDAPFFGGDGLFGAPLMPGASFRRPCGTARKGEEKAERQPDVKETKAIHNAPIVCCSINPMSGLVQRRARGVPLPRFLSGR